MAELNGLQRRALEEALKGLQDLDLNRIVRESEQVLGRQLDATFPEMDAKVKTALVSTVSKTGYSTSTEVYRETTKVAGWIKLVLENK